MSIKIKIKVSIDGFVETQQFREGEDVEAILSQFLCEHPEYRSEFGYQIAINEMFD
jgi:hypothetical protein